MQHQIQPFWLAVHRHGEDSDSTGMWSLVLLHRLLGVKMLPHPHHSHTFLFIYHSRQIKRHLVLFSLYFVFHFTFVCFCSGFMSWYLTFMLLQEVFPFSDTLVTAMCLRHRWKSVLYLMFNCVVVLWFLMCIYVNTYFHVAAGQISHLSRISLFHNTNLRRNKKHCSKSDKLSAETLNEFK